MAEGGYRNVRVPAPIIADEAQVTIVGTAKAIYLGSRCAFPANYWRPGKVVKVSAFGKMTTGATPGNLTASWYYGTGADANGIHIDSVARALIASVTDKTWWAFCYFECRSISTPTAAVIRMWGKFEADLALMLSTAGPNTIPGATPADQTIDITAAGNALTLQCLRSGSTTEQMTTTNLVVEELN